MDKTNSDLTLSKQVKKLQAENRKAKHKKQNPKPLEKQGIGVMNIILIIVGICLFLFTIEMIRTFRDCGAVPDTLITCVYAALGGECGIMGWIKTSKERYRDRTWEVQDRQDAKKKAKE